jgi:hypothetical protein
LLRRSKIAESTGLDSIEKADEIVSRVEGSRTSERGLAPLFVTNDLRQLASHPKSERKQKAREELARIDIDVYGSELGLC